MVFSVALTGMSFAESGQNEVRNGTIKIGSQSEAEYPAMAKVTLGQAIQTALGSANLNSVPTATAKARIAKTNILTPL